MTELQFKSIGGIRFDSRRLLLGESEWRGRKITHVNGERVRSHAQVSQALGRARLPVRIRVKMTGEALDRQFSQEQRRAGAMLRAIDSTGCSVVHNQLAHSTRNAAHRHCPSGHALEGSVKGQCDECGLHASGLGCRLCDYDVCWACAPRPRNDIRGGSSSMQSAPQVELHSVVGSERTPRVHFSTPLGGPQQQQQQQQQRAAGQGGSRGVSRADTPVQASSSVRHYRFTGPASVSHTPGR